MEGHGSPVFINMGDTRILEGVLKEIKQCNILMGIIHGHYDEICDESYEKVNKGIAIVTPIQKIIKFIENKEN